MCSSDLLFSGGFPRFSASEARRAVQRAVFAVQHELEAAFAAQFSDKVLILDRGSIDGAAYWPEGPEDYFKSLGTSLEAELTRYERVIYLESAAKDAYELNVTKNPNRKESWEEARKLDEQTFRLWSKHPNFVHIHNSRSFDRKVSEVLSAVAVNLPFAEESGKE